MPDWLIADSSSSLAHSRSIHTKKQRVSILLYVVALLFSSIYGFGATISASKSSNGSFSHVLIVKSGEVWSWGSNGSGQLGDASTTNRLAPVKVTLPAHSPAYVPTSVAAGDSHSLALTSDGTLLAWGSNASGQLGVGYPANASAPVQVPFPPGVTSFTAIAAGSTFSLAIDNNGKVWAWGSNTSGELGDGSNTQRNSPTAVSGLTGITVTAIIAGQGHSIALKSTGSLLSWGNNGFGQLGKGSSGNSNIPVAVSSLTNVVSIGAGNLHSMAVKSDGTAWVWGANHSGQSGTGGTTSLSPLQLPGVSGAVGMSGGIAHSLLFLADGTVWGSGQNSYGQIGDGTRIGRTSFVRVPDVNGATQVAAGGYFSLSQVNNGTLWAWGDNYTGQLGNAQKSNRLTPTIAVLEPMQKISVSNSHALSVDMNGSVWAWGGNQYGQLGTGSQNVERLVPALVSGITTTVLDVAAGEGHSMALTSDHKVWTWGFNYYGQLGDNTLVSREVPQEVSGLTNVIAIAAGPQFCLALKGDGTVWSWGYNGGGQLGINSTTDSKVPVQVSVSTGMPTTIVEISAGSYHCMARTSAGAAWAWGSNAYGFLGDGTTSPRLAPVNVLASAGVPLSGVLKIVAGVSHSAAVLSGNTVKTWGYNAFGQLGDGTTTQKSYPVTVSGLSNVASVAIGSNHTMAVKLDGSVVAWGSNSNGQLGNGNTTNSSSPVTSTGVNAVAAVGASYEVSFARRADGSVQTWGYASNGQLGIGTATAYAKPNLVSGVSFSHVTPVAAFTSGTLANTTDLVGGYHFLETEITVGDGSIGRVALYRENIKVGEIYDVIDGTFFQIIPTWGNFSFTLRVIDSDGTPSGYLAPFTVSVPYDGDGGTGNGLPDWWEVRALQAGPGVYLPTDDPDGDGSNNLAEFQNGTNPLDFYNGELLTLTPWDGIDQRIVPGAIVPLAQTFKVTKGAGIPYQNASVYLSTSSGIEISTGNSPGGTWTSSLSLTSNASGLVTFYTRAKTGTRSINGVIVAYCGAAAPKTMTTWIPAMNGAGIVGVNNTIVIKDDGSVWAWGSNPGGVLGDGTTTNRTTPVAATSVNALTGAAVTITEGSGHTVCVKDTGNLYAWGANSLGQLGNGNTTSQTSPTLITGATGTVSAAAAGSFTVALKSDGTVRTWGDNSSGQLGKGLTGGSYNTPQLIPSLTNIVAVSAGLNHAVALTSSGTVYACGLNSSGQLGDTTTTTRNAPVLASISNVVAISAGNGHTIAIKADGTVWAWGANSSGELGVSSPTSTSTPIQVPGITNAVVVRAGGSSSVVVLSDGTVRAFGANTFAQLGDGTKINRNAPTMITIPDPSGVRSAMIGTIHGAAISFDGTVSTFGSDSSGVGWLGLGPESYRTSATPVSGAENVVQSSSRGSHVLALTSSGKILAWGDNTSGQLGDNVTAWRTIPHEIAGLSNVSSVSAGGSFSLALKKDGTVWSWGDNLNGQLGDNTTTNRSTPTQVAGISGVIAIATGASHSVALLNDGTVKTWGANFSGQLGDNSTTNRLVPTAVSTTFLSNVLGIAAGDFHTVAIYASSGVRSLKAWGSNTSGQIGDNTTTDRWVPTGVSSLTDAIAISAGNSHTLALKGDQTAWAWGKQSGGALGTGSLGAVVKIPVRFGGTGFNGVNFVSAGSDHSVVVKSDGTAWASGTNGFGRLGDGSETTRSSPVQVTGSLGYRTAAASSQHSIAVKEDGTLFSWGRSLFGQLGVGIAQLQTPTVIPGFTLASTIVPSAAISSPANNESTPMGFDYSVKVSTTGSPSSVSLYYQNVKIGESEVGLWDGSSYGLFEFDWTPETWGNFSFTAIASYYGTLSPRSTAVTLQVPYDGESNSRPDWWDVRYLRNGGYSASLDDDGDGLTNAQELALRSDPYNPDTDGDGFWDSADYDPLNPFVKFAPRDLTDVTAPTITILVP